MPPEERASPAEANTPSTSDPTLPVPDNPGRLVDRFMLISLAIGLALMAGSKVFFNAGAESRLILVMGLGTVLGALGSAAVVKYKAAVITGGAAIGLVLGYVLSLEIDKERENQFGRVAQVQLRGLKKDEHVTMISDSSFFHRERRLGGGRRLFHELIATEEQLRQPKFIVIVTLPAEEGNDAGTGAIDVEFDCVPTAPLNNLLGESGSLRWVFQRDEDGVGTISAFDNNDTGQGSEGEDGVIAKSTGCLSAARPAFTKTAALSELFSISKARAATMTVEQLIDSLEDDSPLGRRYARNELIARGPVAIKPMMAAFTRRGSSYRIRLGTLVSIEGMLNRNDLSTEVIKAELSDTDLEAIVAMSAVKDATMRRYASNLLAKLGDIRAVDKVVKRAESASEGAQTDLLAAIKPAFIKLSDDRKTSINRRLRTITRESSTQTRALVEQTTNSGLSEGQEQKFFVVTGTFTDIENAKRLAKVISEKSGQNAKITQQRPGDSLHRVVVGDYLPRSAAETLKNKVLSSGVVKDAFLSNYPDVLRK